MKKLIAIAVVFALAAGGAFAADIGATVFTGVNLMEGSTQDGSTINGSGAQYRLRLEGAGENEDGNFGAWLRVEGGSASLNWNDDWDPITDGYGDLVNVGFNTGFYGLAWWKPIDQFKLTIGGNPDGLYGKEGYAGWMFYQMPSDVGIAVPHSVWGGPYLSPDWSGYAKYRNAFFGGFGGNGLMLDIMPLDILSINLILPYFDGGELKDIFKKIIAQIDLNLDFGNIAFTYEGDVMEGTSQPTLYAFFGLGAIENLDLAFGFGFKMPNEGGTMNPLAIGLAVKMDVNDSIGFKARLLAQLAGDDGNVVLGFDALPYFGISDNLKFFFGAGLALTMPDVGDAVIGWHINPYLQVGAEWGPTFYAGVKVYSFGGPDAIVKFEVPIGLQVSF
jgi:hypothetical protein